MSFNFVFEATAAEGLRARELIERAVNRSSELKILQYEGDAQRSELSQAAKWEDPVLELGTERRVSNFGETGFGKAGISQFLARPGRITARTDIARADLELSALAREFGEAELRARVLKLIYSHKVASEKAAHAKERYDRFKTVGAYLRSRPFASPQKRAEATIVRSKLIVLQKELHELEAERRVAWIELNHYLEFATEPKLAIAWYKTAPKLSVAELAQKAKAASPEIRRQSLKVHAKESAARLARYETWPGLTLKAVFEQGAGAAPETVYGLGVSLPLPVLNGNRARVEVNESLRLAEEERLQWTRDRTMEKIRSAVELYDAASATMKELSPDKISSLENEMAEIDAGFKKGQVDLITFLEADSQHFATLNAILNAQAEFLSMLTDVTLLVGEAPQPLEN